MLGSDQDADHSEVEPEVVEMEVSAYLARIGFEGDPNISLDCLSRLQAAHQHAVPYENLDVFLGRKKLLEVGEMVNLIHLSDLIDLFHLINLIYLIDLFHPIHLIYLRCSSCTRRWWWRSAEGGAVSSMGSSAGSSRYWMSNI